MDNDNLTTTCKTESHVSEQTGLETVNENSNTASANTVTVNNRIYKTNTNGEIRMPRFHTQFASIIKFFWVCFIVVTCIELVATLAMYISAEYYDQEIYAVDRRGKTFLKIMEWCTKTSIEGIFPTLLSPLANGGFFFTLALALFAGFKDFKPALKYIFGINMIICAVFAILGFFISDNSALMKTEAIATGAMMIVCGFSLWGFFKGKDPEDIGGILSGMGVVTIAGTFFMCHYLNMAEGLDMIKGIKGATISSGISDLLMMLMTYYIIDHLHSENSGGDD